MSKEEAGYPYDGSPPPSKDEIQTPTEEDKMQNPKPDPKDDPQPPPQPATEGQDDLVTDDEADQGDEYPAGDPVVDPEPAPEPRR